MSWKFHQHQSNNSETSHNTKSLTKKLYIKVNNHQENLISKAMVLRGWDDEIWGINDKNSCENKPHNETKWSGV